MEALCGSNTPLVALPDSGSTAQKNPGNISSPGVSIRNYRKQTYISRTVGTGVGLVTAR